jgi:hypothetical protein
MRIYRYLLCIVFTSGLLAAFAQGGGSNWPKIKQETLTFTLSDASLKSIHHIIEDEDGKPAYLLEAYINAYDYATPSAEHLLSGDFECVLTPLYSKVTGINLFTNTEKPKRDWENRARFLLPEIEAPESKQLPGWGRSRTFSLRNMDISINLLKHSKCKKTKLPWWALPGRPRLLSVEIEIGIKPNPNAAEPIHVFPNYENNKLYR